MRSKHSLPFLHSSDPLQYCGWLTEDLFRAVEAAYTEPQRHYHTMNHVRWLITAAADQDDSITRLDWEVLTAAIVYHDFVYDVTRSDNEEQSAVYATLVLPEEIDRERVARIIQATKHHRADDDPVCQIMLDLDMSILSSPPAIYRLYAGQIRREYSAPALPDYVAARIGFLKSVLMGPDIYCDETRTFYPDIPMMDATFGEFTTCQITTETARHNAAAEIGYLTTMPEKYLNVD